MSKHIAIAGAASRRKAVELIRAGRVRVDGKVVTSPGARVDPERSRVEVDGEPVRVAPKVYLLLNKPRGPLSTVTDERGRPTVIDLVGDRGERIYPVGRLDAETEGLLLITNDGDVAYRLTHPRYQVEKVYLAKVEGRPSREALTRLRQGVELEDGLTPPARVRMLRAGEKSSRVELSIHTGRKRQVRRMLKAVGHPVMALRRLRIGPLSLGELPPGHWRELAPREVAELRVYLDGVVARAGESATPGRRKG